jgi:GT2 family glycosyltransferase
LIPRADESSSAGGIGVPTGTAGTPGVAVIVPVGGGAPAWDRCARSLGRLDPAPREIVVVLDGPDDRVAAGAAEIGATVVRLPEPRGPAVARNLGARAAGADILLFIDADIEVPADLVSRVAGLFAERPSMDAVIGSYDDQPGDPRFLSQYRNLLHHFVHQHGREDASTFWAGCGAVRRRAFLDVGGFDARYAEPSIEDIELGARLRRAGHSIRLVPGLQVKHLKRWRLADMLGTDLWRRAVPWTELMLGDGGLVNDLNVKVRDRLSVLAAGLVVLALAGAFVWMPLAGAAVAGLALVVTLNRRLFGFLLRRRGAGFAARSVPLYWTYLIICGLGFAIGTARHLVGRRR